MLSLSTREVNLPASVVDGSGNDSEVVIGGDGKKEPTQKEKRPELNLPPQDVIRSGVDKERGGKGW